LRLLIGNLPKLQQLSSTGLTQNISKTLFPLCPLRPLWFVLLTQKR
jgi:hypothetical protein